MIDVEGNIVLIDEDAICGSGFGAVVVLPDLQRRARARGELPVARIVGLVLIEVDAPKIEIHVFPREARQFVGAHAFTAKERVGHAAKERHLGGAEKLRVFRREKALLGDAIVLHLGQPSTGNWRCCAEPPGIDGQVHKANHDLRDEPPRRGRKRLGQLGHDNFSVLEPKVAHEHRADVRVDVKPEELVVTVGSLLAVHMIGEPLVKATAGPVGGEVGERGGRGRFLRGAGAQHIDGAFDRLPSAAGASLRTHLEHALDLGDQPGAAKAYRDAGQRSFAFLGLGFSPTCDEHELAASFSFDRDAGGVSPVCEPAKLATCLIRHDYRSPFFEL